MCFNKYQLDHNLHRWKLEHVLVTKAVRSLLLILDLNAFNDTIELSLVSGFDQSYGPRNLSKCFLNLTVLYLWMKKSDFLRL